MDYIFNNIQIHIESAGNNRKEMEYRVLVYMKLLQMWRFRQSIKESNTVSDKEGCIAAFWNKGGYSFRSGYDDDINVLMLKKRIWA